MVELVNKFHIPEKQAFDTPVEKCIIINKNNKETFYEKT